MYQISNTPIEHPHDLQMGDLITPLDSDSVYLVIYNNRIRRVVRVKKVFNLRDDGVVSASGDEENSEVEWVTIRWAWASVFPIPAVPATPEPEPEPEPETETRDTYLDTAARIIHGARNEEYGHPYNDFDIIAKFWSAFLGIDIERKQVAAMMVLLKLARLETNIDHEDSWIDIAGYAGCADRIQRVIDGIETADPSEAN